MKKICIALVILVALSVRLYHITRCTEFLGDQGRDALVLRELVTEGKWPAVGPTVGAGHYTGPFYYYLIAPSFVLFKDIPIAPAIEMCIISVAAIALFLGVATSLFSFPIAYGVSFLWALSPLMIIQDRRLWNPTPVPFFILLLISSLIWIGKEKKYWACLTAAVSAAALFQLHYVNGISLFLAGLCFIWIIFQIVKQKKTKQIIPWLVTGFVLFVLLLSPFLIYEAQHGFGDITGSLMTASYKEGQLFSKRLYLNTFLDICSRLASYVIALPGKTILLVISFGIIIANLIRKRLISYVLIAWLGVGIACLSFYKDTFQPQYAYQFIPIVFLLIASAVRGIQKSTSWLVFFILALTITIVSWSVHNPYLTDDPDIPRITALTDRAMLMAGNKPFAFTVVNSRSFTDFHMRYFLLMKHAHLVPFDDSTNKTLMVLCEGGCPKEPLTGKISVMCHTDICPLDKPDIKLSDWTYASMYSFGSSAIYAYTR